MFLEKVTKRFNEQKPPKAVQEVFNQEKEKFILLEETAVEAAVAKKYLEDLSLIPYSRQSEELYDLEFAEKALN